LATVAHKHKKTAPNIEAKNITNEKEVVIFAKELLSKNPYMTSMEMELALIKQFKKHCSKLPIFSKFKN